MEYLKSLGYEVFGVFLQGSQNYNLAYEDSDIDTKAIILPSFTDVVLNKKPVSTTIILDSGEHIDVKDIRLMFENFRKQNINFLEILFTRYYKINPKYNSECQMLWEHREEIAHYNNYASVKCIAGMAFEKYKAMEHPYPTLKWKIDKYGYDPKQLHHIIRCEEFLKRYIG
jgi:predicted nucleotidyltransferase